MLVVEHVLQPALLVQSMDDALDFLHAWWGIFPSERVDIRNTGVNNAVYALGGHTFLELIEPYRDDMAAGRLLARTGPGWHMLACDLEDCAREGARAAIERAGARIVRENGTPDVKAAFHLHPKDCGNVLLLLALRAHHDDNSAWAGKAWREYLKSNARVIDRILGVSIVTDDLARCERLYDALGFDFSATVERDGDRICVARTPRGTFLELHGPLSSETAAARYLERRGPGLYHLALGVRDLNRVVERGEVLGVRFHALGEELWTEPRTTLGVPMAFHRIQ